MLAVAWCAGCDSPHALRRIVPDLAPDMARHLVHADSVTFTRFIAGRGLVQTLNAHGALLDAVPGETAEATATRLDRLRPYLVRITTELARTYRYDRPRVVLARLRALGPEGTSRWFELRARVLALNRERGGDISGPEAEGDFGRREAVAESLAAVADSLGDEGLVTPLFGNLAALHGAHGDRAGQQRWVRRSIEAARRGGAWTLLCQDLGVLGVLHEQVGRRDSMALCWNEALEVARRIRHPEQAPRIASFYASHFWREGRLELAHQWLEESLRLCREFQGEDLEVRFLMRSAEWHADRECWSVVARDLDRVDRLLANARMLAQGRGLAVYRFDARVLRARSWLAAGRIEEASRVFRALESDLGSVRPYPDRICRMYWRWAEGAVDRERPTAARAIIDRGVRLARTYRVAGLEPRLALTTARLALRDGDGDECREALDAFRSLAEVEQGIPPEAWIRHDALRVRLASRDGRRDQARAALDRGMSRLRGFAAGVDASARGYLFLESCRELRLAGHEVHHADAEESLTFDTEWRGVVEALGSGAPSVRGSARSVRGPVAEPPFPIRAPSGTIGIRYLVTDGAVFRWTITSARVRLDRLEAKPEWLERQVATVNAALAREHRRGVRDVHERLHDLAEALLPDEVRGEPETASGPTRLAIAADGFLEQLPFAALNRSAHGFAPLVQRFDVALDRALPPRAPARSGELALVISDPRTSDALRRRVRVPSLPHAREEAARWASLQTRPLMLEGDAATKASLTSRWGGARSLYFATHVVRDGEAPYLQFLGLAAGDDPLPAASVLDVSDIRRARLDGCRIVVLSGCESGAGWSADPVHAPSLGDAFLDAGAETVVQTLWPVRDDGARRIMWRFMDAWRERPDDPVAALARAQRFLAAAADSGGTEDPRPLEWAGYVVKRRSALATPDLAARVAVP